MRLNEHYHHEQPENVHRNVHYHTIFVLWRYRGRRAALKWRPGENTRDPQNLRRRYNSTTTDWTDSSKCVAFFAHALRWPPKALMESLLAEKSICNYQVVKCWCTTQQHVWQFGVGQTATSSIAPIVPFHSIYRMQKNALISEVSIILIFWSPQVPPTNLLVSFRR